LPHPELPIVRHGWDAGSLIGPTASFDRHSDEIGPPRSSYHCRSETKEHVNMVEQAPPWPKQGPASYFPSVEKKYGRSIAEWQQIIAGCGPERHMVIVGYLKSEHGLGHGHANALVGWTLAGNVASP
jgi:Domain of unknown function (DUF4287)